MTVSSQTPEVSLGKRYFFKLSSNIATIPLYFLQEAILPRVLGPAAYGNVNFITAFYTQITNFLDLGTSVCLRTGIAKRPKEAGLISFYLRIAGCILLGMLVCGAVMYLPEVGESLLPGIPSWMVFPSVVCVYLTWLGLTVRGMNDAIGSTTSSELVRIVISIGAAISLVCLFFLGVLDIPVFYVQQGITYGLLVCGYAYTFIKSWQKKNTQADLHTLYRLSKEQRRNYTKEYQIYCSPLFIMALCSTLALVAERWILQYFNGSNAQGYFSLSQKIGMACFLFVTAMMPLLQRDLSMAHEKKDLKAMANIVTRFAPLLYAIAAWFACFTSIEAAGVIRLFAGNSFTEALLPVQIMAFYPIHQCYGQLAGTIFYASSNTHSLRNLTLFGLALGLLCTWIFLAPQTMGGLNLGAAGLSLKMVLVQIITVNILMWRCSRDISFSMKKNVVHQVICPACFLLLALMAKESTLIFFSFSAENLVRFFASGIIYTVLTMGTVYTLPFIVGMSRKDISHVLAKGKSLLSQQI